jgi:hypothetical protein
LAASASDDDRKPIIHESRRWTTLKNQFKFGQRMRVFAIVAAIGFMIVAVIALPIVVALLVALVDRTIDLFSGRNTEQRKIVLPVK